MTGGDDVTVRSITFLPGIIACFTYTPLCKRTSLPVRVGARARTAEDAVVKLTNVRL